MSLISKHTFKKSVPPFNFRILLRNETSRTQLIKSENICVLELRDDGLVLAMPANVCQKGHNVTLFFMASDHEQKAKIPDSGRIKGTLFEALAKIEKVEINPPISAHVFVDVAFTQYQVDYWEAVIENTVIHQEKFTQNLLMQHEPRFIE